MGIEIKSLNGIFKAIALKCDTNNNGSIDGLDETKKYESAKQTISDDTFLFEGNIYSAEGKFIKPSDNEMEKLQAQNSKQSKEINNYIDTRAEEYFSTHGYAKSVGNAKGFSKAYDKKIIKYANKYKLDPNLVKAIIRQESSFNAKAQTPKSAKADCRGLMQINAKYHKGDLYNVDKNLDLGCKILRHSLDTFKGNVTYALMGYNAGEAGAKRMIRKGITSTRYTRSVNNHYNEIKPKKNLSVQA